MKPTATILLGLACLIAAEVFCETESTTVTESVTEGDTGSTEGVIGSTQEPTTEDTSACDKEEIANASSEPKDCEGVKVNAICVIKCNPGYELVDEKNALNCVYDEKSGQLSWNETIWNLTKPACKIAYCEDMTAPENGVILPDGKCINATINDVCQFGCKDNKKILGNANITCKGDDKLQWDSKKPTCKATSLPLFWTLSAVFPLLLGIQLMKSS